MVCGGTGGNPFEPVPSRAVFPNVERPSHKATMQIGEVAKRTSPTFDTIRKAVVGDYPVDCEAGMQPENYSLDGFLSRELTFTPMPKENVLSTLYTLRLYPALKSSERVRL